MKPQAALLSDRELVKTILLFREFSSPEGVTFSFQVLPEPGGCRVWARLAANDSGLDNGQDGQVFPLVQAADEEFMRSLAYVASDLAGRNRPKLMFDYSKAGKDM